jgi:hypothetical protein
VTFRPYLALHPGAVYYLDGDNADPPDWHRLHVALSRVPRFHGYSSLTVLQHAFAVRWFLESQGYDAPTVRLGFLHDHHEALVGDLPTPIKALLGPAWKEQIEAPAERYVRRWFDLDGADERAVKAADVGFALAEAIREGVADFGEEWIWGFDRDDYEFYLPHLGMAGLHYAEALVTEADEIVRREVRT